MSENSMLNSSPVGRRQALRRVLVTRRPGRLSVYTYRGKEAG